LQALKCNRRTPKTLAPHPEPRKPLPPKIARNSAHIPTVIRKSAGLKIFFRRYFLGRVPQPRLRWCCPKTGRVSCRLPRATGWLSAYCCHLVSTAWSSHATRSHPVKTEHSSQAIRRLPVKTAHTSQASRSYPGNADTPLKTSRSALRNAPRVSCGPRKRCCSGCRCGCGPRKTSCNGCSSRYGPRSLSCRGCRPGCG